MGVVQVLVGGEAACLNVESHLLVGIAEGHARSGETVDLFNREHGVVHGIVEDVAVNLHFVNNVCAHGEAVLQFVKGRQEDLLDNLQVAEIAHGQVVHDEHNLLGQSLNLVRFGTYQLKYVGILLVGHDAGARRAFLGQLHEGEVLRVEQTGVEGQFCQCSRDGSHGESHVALHLAASHLGIHYVVVHRIEAQQAGSHLAVQGER